jgi:peptidoglycan hydrolase CwlO-like protein
MVKKIQDNLTNIVVILGLIASIGAGFTKFAKMESTIEQLSNQTAPDLSGIENNGFAILDINKEIALIQKELETHGHNNDHSHDNSSIKILQKEIEVLKLEIEELKEASKNPLS